MGQGEEENMRGMGVFDLGELNLEGGESIYIKGQTEFFLPPFFPLRDLLSSCLTTISLNYSRSSSVSCTGTNAIAGIPQRFLE